MEKIYIGKLFNLIFIVYSSNIDLLVSNIQKLESFDAVCEYCDFHNAKIYIPHTSRILKKLIYIRANNIMSRYPNIIASKEDIDNIIDLTKMKS